MAFGFGSIGHFFAAAVGDLKKVSKAVPVVVGAIQAADKVAEQVTQTVIECGVPQASAALVIERAIDAAAGELLGAVHTTTPPADSAAAVTLTLTRAAFDGYKQFLVEQKATLAALGYVI